jgi:hypothetical protein
MSRIPNTDYVIDGKRLHADTPRLAAIPYLRVCRVPSRRSDVIAPLWRRGRLNHKADRIHEHMCCTVVLCWDLNSAVGVSPRCDLCQLTSSHVSCRLIAADLVPSPEHQHEAVWVLSACNTLQPRTSSF